ncbi:MAG: hypothetical protein GXX79_03500 [Actinomycetales bacterium]|nr:hypothetical protein [Actinomycetales bacterium]
MGPSSLVFVAIVVVWAAYLVPHWARRRESLAQGRTRDRFSEQARVLDRRQGGGRTHTDRPSSLPLHRAVAVSPAGVDTPIPVRRPATHAHRGRRRSPSRPPARPPARPGPPRRAPSRTAARRRAAVLLLLTGVSGLLWILAAVTSLTWRAALPTTVLLGLDVVLLRMAARERAAARAREAAAARRRAASARVCRGPDRAPVAGSRAVSDEASGMPTAEIPVVIDDGTWTPVPVPPPTYTLKPPAPRPSLPAPEVQEVHARSVHEQVAEADLLPDAAVSSAAGSAAGAAAVAGRHGDGPAVARAPGSVSVPAGSGTGRAGDAAVRTEGDRAVDEFDLDGVLERRRAVNG